MFCLDHFSLHRIIKMLHFKVNDPLKDEPLNTFGTLELLFPIFTKKFVLVLFQFPNHTGTQLVTDGGII